MKELDALVILNSLPLLGSVKSRLLVNYFGSASEALNATPAEIAELPGFGPKVVNSFQNWREKSSWIEDLELIERHRVKLIPFTSPDYPKRLLDIPDAPLLLYIIGSIVPSDHYGIAIVGTRNASVYGKEMATVFAQDLSSMGYTIVSGFARGIDTAAHEGACCNGRTLAILGCGLNHLYPPENKHLAEIVKQKGAIISEFPMNTPPDRQTFPQRNRIVSGMTLGTILIEAPEKSGAMLTMNKGFCQGRKLFALPGRVDNDGFSGNHFLIKQGRAILVENAQDVADGLNNLFTPNSLPKSLNPQRALLDNDEQKLLFQLPKLELSIEEIAEKTKLSIIKLNVLLMSLVLKKQLKEFPGKVYKRIV